MGLDYSYIPQKNWRPAVRKLYFLKISQLHLIEHLDANGQIPPECSTASCCSRRDEQFYFHVVVFFLDLC